MEAKSTAKDLSQIAIMSAVICVCAWITIPIPGVPFTLQIFGVFTALKPLGGKKGTISIVLYILLGLVGLPVFSSFQAGPGALFGPTGGYIMGFVIIGLVYWACTPLCRNALTRNLSLIIGLAFCYLFGTFWFTALMTARGNVMTVGKALMLCVIPFILPDLGKLALAELLAGRLKKVVR